MARRHRRPAVVAAFSALPRIVKPFRREVLVSSVSMLSLLAGGMMAGSARAQTAPATTLPGTQILQGGRWSGARLPTVAQGNNGLVMTIKQEQERALLDWAKFNIAANEEVRFDQPSVTSIVLNRIFDARPSEIAGKITANGQVWLANTNGVIFKGGSQVNAHSILATTTATPDSLLDSGLLSQQPIDLYGGGMTYPGMLSGAKGDIVIEKGAKLILSSTDPKVNSKAIFLGVNVTNNGEIRVADGQALLVAGERFLLNPYSEYYSLPYVRGLQAWSTPNYPLYQRYGSEVKYDAEMRARREQMGLRVINNGLIEVTRGNIFLQGAEVQQNGILTATSGVRQRSGSIVLRASYGLDESNLVYSSPQDYYGGSLTIGKGSLTQVLIDGSGDKSAALELFPGGQITFAARDILMDEGSVVRTPGGTVSIFANETPYVAALPGGDFSGGENGSPGTFTMRNGALIDVAGLRDVAFAASDNVVTVEVRANEVSASPNQRDGVLYGEKVLVDIRTGTSIIDWTGALANRNLSAEQRSVNGGSVKINTLRSVRIDNGAKIDISGGSANYAGGTVQYSLLQAADGRIVDIANADAATKYTGLTTVSRTEAGYVEGGNAGNLEILSPSQVLFGRVTSDVINGSRQIAAGPLGVLPKTPTGIVNAAVTPTRMATGATVTISTGSESLGEYWVDQAYITPGQGPATVLVNGVMVTLDPKLIDESGFVQGAYTQASVLGANNISTSYRLAPGWVLVDGAPAELRSALVARGFAGAALEALLQPGAALPTGFVRGTARRFSFIEDDFASGAQNLSFNDKADAASHYWNIQAGANLRVMAGGVLSLSATPMDIGANVTLSAASGTLTVGAARIGAGSVLTTAGLWTNGLDAGSSYGGYVNGGTINLTNAARFEGAVTLDATGGGWWKGSASTGFALVGGQGGSIAIRRASSQSGSELLARLDIRLGGLEGAGTLALQNLGDIVVGPAGGTAPAGVTYLSDATLNGWGVRALSLGSGTFGQPVGAALVGRIATTSVVNPNQSNATAADFYLVTAGDLIDDAALTRITAANALAATWNLANPSAPRPIVGTIDVAATLDIAAGAKIDLKRQRWTLADPSKIVTGSAIGGLVDSVAMSGPTSLSLGSSGYLRSDAASSITVGPQGLVSLSGRNLDLAGDITARGGTINVVGVSGSGALPPRVTIRNGATFDVRGLAQTRIVQGAFGNRYIDGRILAGGAINLAAGGGLVVDSGALFDVSGASGMLTISAPGRYGAVRVDRLIGSDAGSISIVAGGGYMLGEIRGEGGTPDARAGLIVLSGGTGGALFDPGSAAAPYGLLSLSATLTTRLIAVSASTASTSLNATGGTVTKNISVTNLRDWWAAPAQAALRTATGLQASDIEPIPFTRTGVSVTVAGAGGGTFKRVTAADLAPILKYFEQSFGALTSTDVSGRFYLDPTLTELPSGVNIDKPLPGGATIVPTFVVPTDYTPIVSQASFLNAMRALRQSSGLSVLPALRTPSDFTIGKAAFDKLATFDTVTLGAVSLKTDLTIAAKNTLNLSGSISTNGANLTLKAPRLQFGTNSGSAGSNTPVAKPLTTGVLTATANDIFVGGVNFLGFGTVNLNASRTLSGGGRAENAGSHIYATGDLNITAGQIYPYTGSRFTLTSDKSLNIFGNGQPGAAPLSAGGQLVLKAPTINQGGILSAPFGSIRFDGTNINFLAGSVTSVTAGNRTILYGYTLDGSDWYGPTPDSNSDVLLTTPPEKRITINGDFIDLKAGALLDASGGGDVLGLEFVQGPLGANNILTGPGVFAISAALGSNVSLGQAPSDAPRSDLAVGDVVYLGAFDGHAAGYYTLLPAQYALTPGGYRIEVNASGVGEAQPRALGDGTLLVNGYQAGEQGQSYTTQTYTNFSLLSGAEVRRRSEFIETSGNSFFSSERFLTGLERSGALFNANPRLPIDGGFMTIAAKKSLQLNGEFRATGANGASRGGALDIASDFIVIASAGTNISDLGDNYLRLDPKQLSGVAESVLIGGVRRQGAGGLEIVTGYENRDETGAGIGSTVGAERVVVRTSAADAPTGTEFLFAATGEVLFDTGSVVRATGNGFDAEDLILRPELAAQTINEVVFAAQDRGALVRVSNLGDIAITRTGGLTDRGDVTIRSGVILEATDAVALNATRNTTLAGGAIVKAGAIEAAAGSVAFGNAPDAAGGLVLTQAAFDALAGAGTLRLRSLTDFKLYGDVTLKTANDLVLDGGGFVDVDGTGANSFAARSLTLLNTHGTGITATANTASLSIDVDTFNRGAGSIGLSFGTVGIDVAGRALFSGAGTTTVPGALTIRASQVTATGGSTQDVRASGALKVLNQATAVQVAPLETAGASLNLFGSTIELDTAIALGSGVLRATALGDVTVGANANINVSGSAIKFFEKTEYLSAGGIGLASESGNVVVKKGAILDVSGGAGGGDAGSLVLSASRGVALLDGTLKATALTGFRGGEFTLATSTLGDFGGLNAMLNTSGFSRLRRFSIAQGNVLIDGVTKVERFELSTGTGSVTVAGTAQIDASGDKGGTILIASGGDLTVNAGALLDAHALGKDQRGGSISLQVGDRGAMTIGAATLNVSATGTGQAGEVHLRARQIGNDVAVTGFAATVTGGSTQLEAYRVTDLGTGNGVIDSALQLQVTAQAAAFMTGAGAIRTRLGQTDAAKFIVSPGIEIRAGGNLTLVDNWNLKDARYNGAPGMLTLRAGGDLNLKANLSDGFVDAVRTQDVYAPIQLNVPTLPDTLPVVPNKLTNDQSWSYNLVAGADFSQTNVLSTLVSTTGAGDVNLAGMVRTGTGDIKLAASGDLVYAQPDTWTLSRTDDDSSGLREFTLTRPDGSTFTYVSSKEINSNPIDEVDVPGLGKVWFGIGQLVLQDGRNIRFGAPITFSVNNASIYTAGVDAPELADFDTPIGFEFNGGTGREEAYYFKSSYLNRGGDISVNVGGSILGVDNPKASYDWAWWRGAIEPGGDYGSATYAKMGQPYTVDLMGQIQQTSTSILLDAFRQSIGALGGGDVAITAGGNATNLSVALPTSIRVAGGRTLGAIKTARIDGGGDLTMDIGGSIDNGWFYVAKGKSDIRADGSIGAGAGDVTFLIDDATLKVQAGGALRIDQIISGGMAGHGTSFRPQAAWHGYTANSAAEMISLGGDVTYRGYRVDQVYNTDVNGAATYSVLPSKIRFVAPNGSVNFGEAGAAPGTIVVDQFAGGHLDVLARNDIVFYDGVSQGQGAYNLVIGWDSPDQVARMLNPLRPNGSSIGEFFPGGIYDVGGAGYSSGGGANVHSGSDAFSALYAVNGDILSIRPQSDYQEAATGLGIFLLGQETRIKAGDDIRIGELRFYNHDANDVSMLQSGGSIYLPNVAAYGSGRMWVQAGDEIYMGTTPGAGIRSIEFADTDPLTNVVNGVDLTVLAGIDQAPEYAAFLDLYLGLGTTGTRPAYLTQYFTFDSRGLGTANATVLADGTPATIYAVELVNYWNEMNGRVPMTTIGADGRPLALGTLVSKISKADYQAAVTWLSTLDPVKKQPLATRILFAEMKTAGREATASSVQTDPSFTRKGDATRGYDAIGKLFPGAQRKPGEEKLAGESRWFGDIIMRNSQIRADGGGDVEMLVPGGMVQLASLGVTNTSPASSGVLTQDGGNIYALTYGNYVVNQSRTLTADGGNLMIWSSFGNIDAGKGRKSSLSVPPVLFPLDIYGITRVVRSGLPNGAGIATLDDVDGNPGGDVDLYAFNGIVDAGDAGIRASRDLFIGANEIRGLDNITVGGITNVDLGDDTGGVGALNLENFARSAEDEAIEKAFDMSSEVEKLRTVRQTILTGSVVSFGIDGNDQDDKDKDDDKK